MSVSPTFLRRISYLASTNIVWYSYIFFCAKHFGLPHIKSTLPLAFQLKDPNCDYDKSFQFTLGTRRKFSAGFATEHKSRCEVSLYFLLSRLKYIYFPFWIRIFSFPVCLLIDCVLHGNEAGCVMHRKRPESSSWCMTRSKTRCSS